jgi:arginine/lysine/ornithine decarboxylase
VLPALVDAHPARYRDMGLRDLATAMFETMRKLRSTALMAKAFSTLPMPNLSPIEAYERLVRDEVEQIPLAAMPGRTVATGVVPYPPGIPLLMPGEGTGSADGSVLGYLRALETFDRQFPGFATTRMASRSSTASTGFTASLAVQSASVHDFHQSDSGAHAAKVFYRVVGGTTTHAMAPPAPFGLMLEA